jgi:hypothetical protein
MPTLYRIGDAVRGMEEVVDPLHRLVAALDESHPTTGPPMWLRIFGSVANPTRVVEEVRFDRLMGFCAPRSCCAVGVVAGGWASPIGDSTAGAGSSGGPGRHGRERIRTTVVVSRDGAVGGRLRLASGQVVDEPPGSGRILDCLRRAFRLPTEPPPVGTDVLFASMWLAAVTDAARHRGAALSWPEVAGLHPVAQLVEGELGSLAGSLVDAAGALAVACPWSEVRRLISEGGWEDSDVPVATAAWMDDGMLSRWLLDGRPTVGQLADTAAARLSPRVASRMRRTLRQLGLAGGPVSTCRRWSS